MSGNPPGASVIDNVVESVGTTASDPTSFSWTCPPVDFDGPVYSYMFTPNDSLDPPEYSSQFTASIFRILNVSPLTCHRSQALLVQSTLEAWPLLLSL